MVGICPDFHFRPLQYPVAPFAFVTIPGDMKYFFVRMAAGADFEAVCDHIRRCVERLDPDCEPLEIRFLDEDINAQYARERRITTIVGLFTVLAVVIALMGVFGIVLFETQYRRREVAVRKVMGATTGEVLRLFNRRYLWMVVICFVIALPLSLWIVNRWMASFAYRAPFTVWIPVAALAAVLLVTAATVTFCSWRTANENPAESVKSE